MLSSIAGGQGYHGRERKKPLFGWFDMLELMEIRKKKFDFYHVSQARTGQAVCIHMYNQIMVLNLRWEVMIQEPCSCASHLEHQESDPLADLTKEVQSNKSRCCWCSGIATAAKPF